MKVCISRDEKWMNMTSQVLHLGLVERIGVFGVPFLIGMSSNFWNANRSVDVSAVNRPVWIKGRGI